jgi:hypothetical protein
MRSVSIRPVAADAASAPPAPCAAKGSVMPAANATKTNKPKVAARTSRHPTGHTRRGPDELSGDVK